jgi:hypothetical protein
MAASRVHADEELAVQNALARTLVLAIPQGSERVRENIPLNGYIKQATLERLPPVVRRPRTGPTWFNWG